MQRGRARRPSVLAWTGCGSTQVPPHLCGDLPHTCSKQGTMNPESTQKKCSKLPHQNVWEKQLVRCRQVHTATCSSAEEEGNPQGGQSRCKLATVRGKIRKGYRISKPCLATTAASPPKMSTASFPTPTIRASALHHLWDWGTLDVFLSGCSWAWIFSAASPFTTMARTCALGDSQLEGLLPQRRGKMA